MPNLFFSFYRFLITHHCGHANPMMSVWICRREQNFAMIWSAEGMGNMSSESLVNTETKCWMFAQKLLEYLFMWHWPPHRCGPIHRNATEALNSVIFMTSWTRIYNLIKFPFWNFSDDQRPSRHKTAHDKNQQTNRTPINRVDERICRRYHRYNNKRKHIRDRVRCFDPHINQTIFGFRQFKMHWMANCAFLILGWGNNGWAVSVKCKRESREMKVMACVVDKGCVRHSTKSPVSWRKNHCFCFRSIQLNRFASSAANPPIFLPNQTVHSLKNSGPSIFLRY